VTQISKIERNEKGNYLFLGDELKPKYNIGDRCYLTEPTRNLAGADYTNKKLHIQYFWHSPESKWVTPTEQDLIKINKLLDITAEAAIAEGIEYDDYWDRYWDYMAEDYSFKSPIDSYISEIEMLHGKAIANSNPWLWVYKFKLIGNNNE